MGEACTVFVSAVDNQPIEKSRRLLLMHLTDVQNNKIKFNKDLTIWEEVGQLPHLVRQGKATVTLRVDGKKKVQVWAVDLAGVRKKQIAITQTESAVTIPAETISPDGTFLAYEIIVDGGK
jgi:hypothetical protein